jgi:hypothetical protein
MRKSIIKQGFRNTLKHGVSLLYHFLRRTASSDFIFPLVSDLRRASRRKKGNHRYQTCNAITNRFNCLLCILLIYLSSELFHNVILNFDRAREITMAFFSDTRDPKFPHVNASVFGRPRGEPLLVDEHPVLEPALTLPQPVVEGMGPPDLYAQ